MMQVWNRRDFLTGLLAAVVLTAGAPLRAQKESPPPEDRIDLNHASLHALMKVPGMTPVWAARIVRFRPYHAKNDLVDRGVVTSEVYARIKDYVIAHREKR